jgi:hypothetical protein
MIKKYITYLNESDKIVDLSGSKSDKPEKKTFPGNLNISGMYLFNYRQFNEQFLNFLKKKYIGKSLLIKGSKRSNDKKDKENNKNTYSYYKIDNVTDIKPAGFSGYGRDNVQNYHIYDENGNIYLFKEIVTEEEFAYRMEQIEIKRKEKELIRLKRLEVDPYDEEDWDHIIPPTKKKELPIRHGIVRPAVEGGEERNWFDREEGR